MKDQGDIHNQGMTTCLKAEALDLVEEIGRFLKVCILSLFGFYWIFILDTFLLFLSFRWWGLVFFVLE